MHLRIELDDDLVQQAGEAIGIEDLSELVDAALRVLL
jgi:Arc/MetJ family transcription regulator